MSYYRRRRRSSLRISSRSRKRSNSATGKIIALLLVAFLFFGAIIGKILLIVAVSTCCAAILGVIICLVSVFWGYGKSEYKTVTGKSFFKVLFDKGAFGEYMIYRTLRNGEGKWLFNLYLPTENGKTTEIDLLWIRENGLYVFESKNYKGWIFGTETNKTWVQTIKKDEYRRAKKYYFLNPTMQNALHIKHLKRHLADIQEYDPRSLIVFGNRCKLRNISVQTNKHTILQRKDLKKLFACENASAHISCEVLERIYKKLYEFTQVSEAVKQQHILDVEKAIAEDCEKEDGRFSLVVNQEKQELQKTVPSVIANIPEENKAENPATKNTESHTKPRTCPRCGAPLVLRVAKQSTSARKQFYGCSRYPNCRYTESV